MSTWQMKCTIGTLESYMANKINFFFFLILINIKKGPHEHLNYWKSTLENKNLKEKIHIKLIKKNKILHKQKLI